MDVGQHRAHLEAQIEELQRFLDGMPEPLQQSVLDVEKTKARARLTSLVVDLARLDAKDGKSTPATTAIHAASAAMVETFGSTLNGGGWASRPESVAIGSTGIASRFSTNAYPNTRITVPLLWQHDQAKPIGVAKLSRRDGALWADWTISPTALGNDVWTLILDNVLNGQSLGFAVTKSHNQDGVRVVDACQIQELSLVTFPADAAARIVTADGKSVTLHCAPAREFASLTGLAAPAPDDVERTIREAEAWVAGEKPKSKTHDVLDFDFCRNRPRTPEEREQQERSGRMERMYRALQRDPGLARLPVEVLNTILESIEVM
jgi:HK97 family phage prohead protease